MKNVLVLLFSSRKFVSALVGMLSCFLIALVGDQFPFVREAVPYLVFAVVALVATYIGATGYEDGQEKRNSLSFLTAEEAKQKFPEELEALLKSAIDTFLKKEQEDVKG